MMKNIFIVVPAFNEAERIGSTLADLHRNGYEHIVVVDDGSTDNTARQAMPSAHVIRHTINRGMGASLMTGVRYALAHDAEYIVHFDADGQHSASDIQSLLEPLIRDTADIALGSRYLTKNALPWSKKVFIHAPALLFQRLTTGMQLTDVHNGFRAMNRHAAECIRLVQDRMAHASEIIYEIQRNGLRYTEVPVTISYRKYGQGFIAGLRILKDLLVRKLYD